MSHRESPSGLRPFRSQDTGAVHTLIYAMIDVAYRGVYPERAIAWFKRHHSPDHIRARARDGYTVVIEQDGRIVATGSLIGDNIGAVFVTPGTQRGGLGRAVMEHLEERARAASIAQTTLSISLPSRGFYERLGYEVSDKLFFDVGEGQTLDYWLGRKDLGPPTAATAESASGGPPLPESPMEEPFAHSLYADDAATVSALDEFSVWAAPFGLRLLEAVELGRGLRVLDIGFGTGFPLLELAAMLGASSTVWGLDPWKAGHERTKFKMRQCRLTNVWLIEATAEKMPFAPASFDRVVSNNGFNNVGDMAEAFRETARVCRPGAQLVFTMNLDGSMHELHEEMRRLFDERGLAASTAALAAYIYDRRKPLDEVLEHVRAAGFRVDDVRSDEFALRYADGAAMLDHPFIRTAFLDAWRGLVPEAQRDDFFAELTRRLDGRAAPARARGLCLSIPFATVVARRG
jgi:arsenite methyltransferase